ncbi:ABC transporter permease [Mediannikoviicoccus vaginalis]|uniref:ABC transporter permease n=1 Tax=Mediannikoviicoccus vaginalis TaxID=2899727 RepID=UPI001F3F9579|nr:ABC transporter permease [Mediannikoviicoccus vaginalis]
MFKNALRYVTRKKNRTIIVFIILTIVLSCLYSSLSVLKSSGKMEESLYKTSNSSLALTRKDNGHFEANKFKDIEKIKEIDEVVYQYFGLAVPNGAKVVEGEQKVQREDLPSEFKNIMAVEGATSTKRNVLFSSGVFTIKEGRHIEKGDVNKVLVHEEFAKKNNLKLHDKIGLEFVELGKVDSNKEEQFEIVGIFSGKKQEMYTGMSSDFSENNIFVDYEGAQSAIGRSGDSKIVNKVSLFSETADKMESAMDKIKEIDVTWEDYNLEKDSNAFEEALESVTGIKHIIKIMTYAIMIGGVVVLSLILILWLRERIYEIGILLSIGVSKAKIVGQFILELLFISIPATVFSLLFGNIMLSQIIGGFINSEGAGAVTDSMLKSGNFAESLITFLQSYGLLLSIIILSVLIASLMILIKKPKKILSKIS